MDLVVISRKLDFDSNKYEDYGEKGQWPVFKSRKVGGRAELLHIPEGGPKLDIRMLYLSPEKDIQSDKKALQKYAKNNSISMRNFVVGREFLGGSKETAKLFEKHFIKTIGPERFNRNDYTTIYCGDPDLIGVALNPLKSILARKLKKSKPKKFIKDHSFALRFLGGKGLHGIFDLAYRNRGLDYLERIKNDDEFFSTLRPSMKKKIESAIRYARKKGYFTKNG